jgi:hypothetical protein
MRIFRFGLPPRGRFDPLDVGISIRRRSGGFNFPDYQIALPVASGSYEDLPSSSSATIFSTSS